jgi:hypothetical protein
MDADHAADKAKRSADDMRHDHDDNDANHHDHHDDSSSN